MKSEKHTEIREIYEVAKRLGVAFIEVKQNGDNIEIRHIPWEQIYLDPSDDEDTVQEPEL